MFPLRVVVWNVHGFRAGVHPVTEAIAQLAPDLVLLNEARFRWRVHRAARNLGMRSHLGLVRGGAVPNAILVRPPWRFVESWVAPLSPTAGLKRRGVVAARIGRAGQRVMVVCTHLGVSDGERVRHAGEVTDMLAGAPAPLLLGGDFNEGPDGPASSWIAGRYWDAFARAGSGSGETFPARRPRARIDYLFVTEDVTLRTVRVGDAPQMVDASDHRPLIADVEVGS